ncbi:MAG: hypothetical protein LBQ92_05685 [Propionibacteriaceae bacterium]|nr:hypothetical protein [Propionibacteriaceae bacterium]
MQNEGLRVTSAGGHIGLYEAVRAQPDPPLGKLLRPFQRMRRLRNSLEYPNFAEAAVTPEVINSDSAAASAIIAMAQRMLEEMAPF